MIVCCKRPIGPLHDLVTWYKFTHAGEQVAQWDFQKNAPGFVWKSHCATCKPACVILYHVTASRKGSFLPTYKSNVAPVTIIIICTHNNTLKLISSPYCALSRVCYDFCFVSCKTSQKVAFRIYLHEVNSKFHVNRHYRLSDISLDENLHSCKKQ